MKIRPLLLALLGITFLPVQQSNAQLFKNLGKKVEKAAERGVERTVERRTEKEASKKTDEALDGVLGEKKKPKSSSSEETMTDGSEQAGNQNSIISGSSFFPKGRVIYSENFSKDAPGDFPAGWETNAGGEIVLIDDQKALKMYPNGVYVANTGSLPENYALEFDLTTQNMARENSAGSGFYLYFNPTKTLERKAPNSAVFGFSLWKGTTQPNLLVVENWGENITKIQNKVQFEMDEKLNTTTHFTVVVNGKRLRVYADNEKAIDLPSLLPNGAGRQLSFYLWGTKTDKNHFAAISNITITEEGVDARSQILKQLEETGSFSTNAILFATGSDRLESSSFNILDQVANALEQSGSMRLKIIGHTDSDGSEHANLELSRKRAERVKIYLASKGIASERMETDGKGESQPVASNSTEQGKAQNRRVEFLRQ